MLVADRSTPTDVRTAVAAVAYVARRGIDYKVGYDGTMTDENPRLYVVADGFNA